MPTAYIYKPGTGARHKTLYADQGVVGFGFEGQAEAFRQAIATGLVGLASLPASSSIPDFQRDGKRESQSKVARQWEVLRGLQPGDLLIAVEGTKWAVGVALLTADPVSPEESERLASLTVQEEPHSIFVRARWHLFQAPLEMKFVSGANAAQETIYRVTPARAAVLLEHLDGFGLQATAREQVVTALSSAKDGASESTPEPKRRLMAARYSWLLGHGCSDGKPLSVQVSNTENDEPAWKAEGTLVVSESLNAFTGSDGKRYASADQFVKTFTDATWVASWEHVWLHIPLEADVQEQPGDQDSPRVVIRERGGKRWVKLSARGSVRSGVAAPAVATPPHKDSGVVAQRHPVRPHPLNLLLEGVPGTGKTYRVREIVGRLCGAAAPGNTKHGEKGHACPVAGDGQGRFAVTMHPATTYEEFVEGLRPAVKPVESPTGPSVRILRRGAQEPVDPADWFWTRRAGLGAFEMTDGFFVRVCAEAVRDGDRPYVVLLDEFNRCNIPKVLGDLLTTLEPSKRARWIPGERVGEGAWDLDHGAQVVTLPGSGRQFFVPDNVYVVATMNSSDRSVGSVDAALRRRFAADRSWPIGFGPDGGGEAALKDRINEEISNSKLELPKEDYARVESSVDAWHVLNVEAQKISPDAMLGHSYLFDLAKGLAAVGAGKDRDRRFYVAESAEDVVLHVWNQQILPQLCESLEAAHKSADAQEWHDAIQTAAAKLSLDVEPQAISATSSLHRRVSIRFRARQRPNAEAKAVRSGTADGVSDEPSES